MSGFMAGYFLAMALHYGGLWWLFCGVSLTWFVLLTYGQHKARQQLKEYVETLREEEQREENDHHSADRPSGRLR